jgi:hypothetical protein
MMPEVSRVDSQVMPVTIVTADSNPEQRRGPGLRSGKRRKRSPGMSIFWGISGGSLLGAAGFVLLTLYQQYDNSVTELERDLKHFNESCAGLVRKEELSNRTKTQWEAIQKLDKTLNEKSERISLLEHEAKFHEQQDRELLREVQRLRERLAAIEGKTSVLAPISHAEP